MSNKYLVIALLFIGLMQSCTQNKIGKDISIQKQSFSRMDFAETKDLKSPEKIVLKDVLYPASFRVIKDSILVINNQPVCDYLIELYSLNTLQPILRIVPKGKGPEEMISCWLSLHTNNNHRFYLQDDKTKTYYTVDIDSIMKYRKLYVLSKFKYTSEILSMADICVTDSNKYIGYHMWYLDNEKYGNGISEPLSYYNINEDNNKESGDFSFFVSSVNGACFFRNPKTGQIWSIDMHRDQICMYDDSLRLLGTLNGPDQFVPQYKAQEIPAHLTFVTFLNEQNLRAYSDYFITDKHIYLVYEGKERFDMENMGPMEVFKIDFDGNLLCNYKVDRHIHSISVDKNEKYLYCVGNKSVREDSEFLRYEL